MEGGMEGKRVCERGHFFSVEVLRVKHCMEFWYYRMSDVMCGLPICSSII